MRLKTPAVLIHFNNGSFGWIKALQALHANGKFFSVDFKAGQPSRVAEGFGMKASHVNTPAELDEGSTQRIAATGLFFLML